MIWRLATNPEISFEIDEEGNALGFSINPKFQTNINANADIIELYNEMITINENLEDEL